MSDIDGDIGLFYSRRLDNDHAQAQQPHQTHPNRRPSLHSPSSPYLPLPGRTSPRPSGHALTRSRTLPKRRTPPTAPENTMELEKLQNLQLWIVAIALVTFDLDSGPTVDFFYPFVKILGAERENIAFSAFPDSPQFDQGSQGHSFRIRYPSTLLEGMQNVEYQPQFLYGFSHFTQQRDSSSKRGYDQHALVFLTQHPLPALYSALMTRLAPLYEQHGSTMLEAACHNIGNWPPPVWGTTVELGFLGSVLHAVLPSSVDEHQSAGSSTAVDAHKSEIKILTLMAPTSPPPLHLFAASLSHMWSIWECFVLSEPILVFGPSPTMTSQAIWWFVDIMRPLPIAGDFRPYFTIHDNDFPTLVNKMPPKSGLLLGVTNPFFEAACKHWPHVLSLGREHPLKPPTTGNHSLATSSAPLVGPIPGWTTKTHKRYISKDKALLKAFEEACRNGRKAEMEGSFQLRRHFSDRTNALLVPLNRYLNTLIPSPLSVAAQRSDSAYASDPCRMKAFSSSDFFASLKTHGSPLPFKTSGKQKEFYQRWLKTPTFGMWLANQEEIVRRVLVERIEKMASTQLREDGSSSPQHI